MSGSLSSLGFLFEEGLLLLGSRMPAWESRPTVVGPDDAVEIHDAAFVAVLPPEGVVEHPVLSRIIGDNLCVVACADEKTIGCSAKDDIRIVVI